MSDALDNIIRHGNRHPEGRAADNWLVCADGFHLEADRAEALLREVQGE